MRYAFILLVWGSLLPCLGAQTMNWVPTKQLDKRAGCPDQTSCADNLVCYTLAYTPQVSGEMTSYTTGFRVDCTDGGTSIVSNASCSMNDNSEQRDACAEIGQFQLLSSGNTGSLDVIAGQTVYLHQICLQTARRGPRINFFADPILGLSTSIIKPESGIAVSEEIGYAETSLPRNQEACRTQISVDGLSEVSYREEVISLVLAPNPASDHLYVEINLPGEEETELRILDLQGRLVARSFGAADRRETFDLSRLPAGTYYLSAGDKALNLTEKFVIAR